MDHSPKLLLTFLALFSAGVSLVLGIIYLFVSIQRKNRAYFLFSIMGLLLFIYFVWPPVGFILDDEPPYPTNLLWKRIFIFGYYGLTPWFILGYSRYPKRALAYVISGLAVVCYIVMAQTVNPVGKPSWAIVASAAFGFTFLLGVVAARWQHVQGDRRDARWLGMTMVFYGVLCVLTTIHQLNPSGIGGPFNVELFFPMHFHAVFFMMAMGHSLVSDLLKKHTLELNVLAGELRWNSFMANAPFIIVELDLEGKIIFINDFGVKRIGHNKPSEIIGTNWYEQFLNPEDRHFLKDLYRRAIEGEVTIPTIRWTIRTRQGEDLVVNWSNFLVTNPQLRSTNIMSIGKDITLEEKTTQLVNKLKNELLKDQLSTNVDAVYSDLEIVGTSKALRYAIEKARQVSVTQAPVLLEGETGVGKELFANLIHGESSRSAKPFIKVNCGALPKELIEDELFGHEKGAFTSANQARTGRFELAHGGTIFLDEIGELALEMQPKLLRVLQNGEFERIGGQKTIKVDVRILAATNRNLLEEVQAGRFRRDLYYRLSVFPITIPPLRNRKDDLPMLINFHVSAESRKYNKAFAQVSHTDMQRLIDHDWPGNIRELKNVIERSVIISEGPLLRLDWWDVEEGDEEVADDSLIHMEHGHIMHVLEKCRWKINGEDGAAKMLKMNPNTLRSRMKRLGIHRPGTKDDFRQGIQ